MIITLLPDNRTIDVPGGTTVSQLHALAGLPACPAPICARVNNKFEDLSFSLFCPKQVEYITPSSPEGMRCCVRSLCLMLYRAVTKLYPGARLRVRNSISHGYYCTIAFPDGAPRLPRPEVAAAVRAEMQELVARDLPIVRSELPTPQVAGMLRAQGLDEKARLIEDLSELYTVVYTLDTTTDTCIGPLAPSTGMLGVFDFIPWGDGYGYLLVPPSKDNPLVPAVPVEQPKLARAFAEYQRFNRIVGISGAADVHSMVRAKQAAMMVNIAEALSAKHIRAIADAITARFREGQAKIVLIAGPSSSGKTTFTKRLAIELLTNLIRPVMISLDDYFVDRHLTPVDEDGEYDYESIDAIDLRLFNAHLLDLTQGKEVNLPTYNFETGTRQYQKDKVISLPKDSILLIEGIHGLNPSLTERIPEKLKYRVYVSALTTIAVDEHNWIPTTDTRLIRRIVRDCKYRGTSPLDTIRRWPSVRRGEEKWIFPYQENADSMFNSSLLFELSVMRDEAERVLRTVPRTLPEYALARRLRLFLSYFPSIPTHLIPPTSLLREFHGGSTLKY